MFSNNFYNIEQESSDAVYLQIKYLKMKGKNTQKDYVNKQPERLKEKTPRKILWTNNQKD